MHKKLMNMLAKYLDMHQWDWDLWVPFILLRLRNSPHSSHGFSPSDVMMGYTVRTPLLATTGQYPEAHRSTTSVPEFVIQAKEKLIDSQLFVRKSRLEASARGAKRYNQGAVETVYPTGSLVWYRDVTLARGETPKLALPWIGPLRVIEQVGPVNYRLAIPGKRRLASLVHVQRLKPYTPRERPDEAVQELQEGQLEARADDEFDDSLSVRGELSAEDQEDLLEIQHSLEQGGDPAETLDHDVHVDSDNETEGATTTQAQPFVKKGKRIARFSPGHGGEIDPDALAQQEDSDLRDLLEMQYATLADASRKVRVNSAKATLLGLIGRGSPVIRSAALESKFDEEIRACKSREALRVYVQDLVENFEERFPRADVHPSGVPRHA
jgi:hypothetical protein